MESEVQGYETLIMGLLGGLAVASGALLAAAGGSITFTPPAVTGFSRDDIEKVRTAAAARQEPVTVGYASTPETGFVWNTSYVFQGFIPFGNANTAALGSSGLRLSASVGFRMAVHRVRITTGNRTFWVIEAIDLARGEPTRLPIRNTVTMNVTGTNRGGDYLRLVFTWTETGLWKTFSTSAWLDIPFDPADGVRADANFREAVGEGWAGLSAGLVAGAVHPARDHVAIPLDGAQDSDSESESDSEDDGAGVGVGVGPQPVMRPPVVQDSDDDLEAQRAVVGSDDESDQDSVGGGGLGQSSDEDDDARPVRVHLAPDPDADLGAPPVVQGGGGADDQGGDIEQGGRADSSGEDSV